MVGRIILRRLFVVAVILAVGLSVYAAGSAEAFGQWCRTC